MLPPDGEGLIRISTLEGKRAVDPWPAESDDRLGARREALVEPPRIAHWFGFVKDPALEDNPDVNEGTVSGVPRT